jgi:sterol 14-demethylase
MIGITSHLQALFAERISAQFIAITIALFLIVAVLANALKQVFLKDRNKPPVVFHWFPIIGSTITYGIDPLKVLSRPQGAGEIDVPRTIQS